MTNALGKGLVIAMGILQAACAPAINDITTDLADPPVFKTLREGKKQVYPEQFAKKQSAHYKDLRGLMVPVPPSEAFDAALKAAKAMLWEVVRAERDEGHIEAVDTTLIFRFKDDVVVRIRPEGEGSQIDVRSASRVGKGDLGKNASRIKAYLQKIESKLGAKNR